jgi:superoxide dismutase
MENESFIKDRRLVKNQNLSKLQSISTFDTHFEKKVDFVFDKIKDRYTISEEELYEKLYLKVRKMFIEEERD